MQEIAGALLERANVATDAAVNVEAIERAKADPNTFIEWCFEDERGRSYKQAQHHREWQELLSHDRVAILGHAEGGKALPLDTPIPTPSGFVRMGDLRTGDIVFGRDGRPTRVTGAFQTFFDHDVYEVVFDDGASLRADGEHLWSARSIDDRAAGNGGRVVTTEQIASCMRRNGRAMWTMPVPEAVQYPARDLPIAPYVLGVWLGDGNTADSQFTFHADDREVYERCRALEGAGEPRPDQRFPNTLRATLGPGSLRGRLRALGLIGSKSIPEPYLLASVDQRKELLAGLLDTDGYVESSRNKVEFTSTVRALADGVLELVRSLGIKATLREGRATLNGEDKGPKWRVCFSAPWQVFRLARKAARLDFTRPTNGTTRERSVVEVRRVESVPVRCIAVEATDRLYLAGRDYVVTHNTTQLALRIVWELGHNPELRIAIIAAKEENAEKILGVIKRAIEENHRVQLVFPELKPGRVWGSNKLLVAGRRRTTTKDFSVQAYGAGSAFLGIRADIMVCDDINDPDNSRTELMRARIISWFDEKVQTRCVADGRIWCIGNAWDKEDLIHTLARRPGFVFRRYSVLTDDGMRATWPAQFPLARIAKLRANMPPLSFARAYLCLPLDDETSRFDEAWFWEAKRKGLGLAYAEKGPLPVLDEFKRPIPGQWWQVYVAVDLASGKAGRARQTDTTALVAIAYLPKTGMIRVLESRVGRWKAPEIVALMRELDERYGSPVFCVEDNGNQQLFVDSFDLVGLRVVGLTTGEDKWDPVIGVEGMAISMHAGKWLLPATRTDTGDLVSHDAIEVLLEHLLGFTPAEHTPDDVMALWIATKAARIHARGYWGITARLGRR